MTKNIKRNTLASPTTYDNYTSFLYTKEPGPKYRA